MQRQPMLPALPGHWDIPKASLTRQAKGASCGELLGCLKPCFSSPACQAAVAEAFPATQQVTSAVEKKVGGSDILATGKPSKLGLLQNAPYGYLSLKLALQDEVQNGSNLPNPWQSMGHSPRVLRTKSRESEKERK